MDLTANYTGNLKQLTLTDADRIELAIREVGSLNGMGFDEVGMKLGFIMARITTPVTTSPDQPHVTPMTVWNAKLLALPQIFTTLKNQYPIGHERLDMLKQMFGDHALDLAELMMGIPELTGEKVNI